MARTKDGLVSGVGDQPRETFMFEGMKINRCDICKNPKRHKAWCAAEWETRKKAFAATSSSPAPADPTSPREASKTTHDPLRADHGQTAPSNTSENSQTVQKRTSSQRTVRPCPFCPCKTRKHLHRDARNCLFYAYYKKRLTEDLITSLNPIVRQPGENNFDACAREYRLTLAANEAQETPQTSTTNKEDVGASQLLATNKEVQGTTQPLPTIQDIDGTAQPPFTSKDTVLSKWTIDRSQLVARSSAAKPTSFSSTVSTAQEISPTQSVRSVASSSDQDNTVLSRWTIDRSRPVSAPSTVVHARKTTPLSSRMSTPESSTPTRSTRPVASAPEQECPMVIPTSNQIASKHVNAHFTEAMRTNSGTTALVTSRPTSTTSSTTAETPVKTTTPRLATLGQPSTTALQTAHRLEKIRSSSKSSSLLPSPHTSFTTSLAVDPATPSTSLAASECTTKSPPTTTEPRAAQAKANHTARMTKNDPATPKEQPATTSTVVATKTSSTATLDARSSTHESVAAAVASTETTTSPRSKRRDVVRTAPASSSSRASASSQPPKTNAQPPNNTSIPYPIQPGMTPYMWYLPAMVPGQLLPPTHPSSIDNTRKNAPSSTSSARPITPQKPLSPVPADVDPSTRPTVSVPRSETAANVSKKRQLSDENASPRATSPREDDQGGRVQRRRHDDQRFDLLRQLLSVIERDQVHAKAHDDAVVKLQLERLEFDRELQRERIAFDKAQATKAEKRFEANQEIIHQLLAQLNAVASST